ncbi:MAG: Hsp20/alpha crystallin family protein [Spirochaetaceae bacterium]|nr:Hsp20/alpha crystallin family protein [Spirochaetaceae bacterium]
MNKIVTYRPFGTTLSPVWDNFLEDFFDISLSDNFKKPVADIIEKDKSYGFEIELPGFTENEIDVRIEKNVLTVKAEKETKEEEKGKDKHIISERVEKYYRSFILPEKADEENIEAKFDNGILALEILKKEKKEPKKVEIKK